MECQNGDAAPLPRVGLSMEAKRSVRVLLLLQLLLSGVGQWAFGPLFDVDLFIISGGSNVYVGVVESVRGITGLLAAVPLGYAADRIPRVSLLRLTALFVPIVVVVAGFGLIYEDTAVIMLGASLFAVISQSFAGAIVALLADLAPPGALRRKVMGWQVAALQLGNAGGPTVQLLVILSQGSGGKWTSSTLKPILISGLALLVPVVPLTWCLRNESCADDGHVRQEASESSIEPANGPSPPAARDETSRPLAGAVVEAVDGMPMWARRKLCGKCHVWHLVVTLVETSFVVTLLVTGMCVKYFPLFFKQDFGFHPAAICVLSALYPLFVAAFVPVCVRLGGHLGVVPGILAMTTLGGLVQALMGLSAQPHVAVVLFFMRQLLMKTRDPLYQGLLMDCLPKNLRGRFGSLASLRSMTWAGSAVLGGIILDHTGGNYRQLILISGALISVLPTSLAVPLLFFVPRTNRSGAS